MSITALTIENFKSISKPVRVELKPITLLFGPNSVGKSTIVQALHYVREILSRGNVDADQILGADASFNLGGFTNFVNNHDLSKKIRIKVEFDIDFDSIELEPFLTYNHRRDVGLIRNELWDMDPLQVKAFDLSTRYEIKSAWIELTVSWNKAKEKPYLSQYETGINTHPFARIVCTENSPYATINYVNVGHPTFQKGEEGDYLDQEYEQGHIENSLFEDLVKRVVNKEYMGDGINVDLPLPIQETALPKWGEVLILANECFVIQREDITYEEGFAFFQQFSGYLSQLIVGPGEALSKKLSNARYLGPLRKIPPRNYTPTRSEDPSRWSSGLSAWDKLHLSKDEFVVEVGKWLSGKELLNSGYSLNRRRFKELDVDSHLYSSLVSGQFINEKASRLSEIANLPERIELSLFDQARHVNLRPQDVGVGISQLLPVIVGVLDQDIEILSIEQPELHIHPGLQCRIGDLLISQIQDADKLFIIETHSEHLLLRLLRRIREQFEGEVPSGMLGLTPDQLSVNFLEMEASEGLIVRLLEVNEEGDSIGEWPRGFFAERAAEM